MSRLKLIAKGPTYFSQGDEKAFFDWLESISCVKMVGGEGTKLHVSLSRPPNNSDLGEFLALFFRYRMNMRPLAAFLTKRNAMWFQVPNTYWHAKVFGKPAQKAF